MCLQGFRVLVQDPNPKAFAWSTVLSNPFAAKQQAILTGHCWAITLQSTMDLTYLAEALPATKQEIIWWSCFSILTYAVFKILLQSNVEDAIEFSVPVPEACRPGWKGKQLDDPSIKVQSKFLDDGKVALIELSFRCPAAQQSSAIAQQQASLWALSIQSLLTALIASLRRPARHSRHGRTLHLRNVDRS